MPNEQLGPYNTLRGKEYESNTDRKISRVLRSSLSPDLICHKNLTMG
jgi:hypothetical protein